ncbi:hypothetical protein Q4E40_13355 [Pontibacter sp. BT731]|uniref:hypothetical protein n=1 Tax=Pontibacter coccineus TaxID=3063328 RepID=UPI0026E3FFB7|nr:hypothetical protein [Pontibacter sp. BT731]MDO6391120.1 hypothetical protein [Pontibacter sp. BT731]
MKEKAFPFVLFFFLSISSSAFGQRAEEKIRFHIAPLNFFDPVTGVLQIGVQKNLHQRFALSIDHGFKMQTFRNLVMDGESERKNYRYSKTKAELKYFVGQPRSVASSYLSVEGMYFPQQYVKEKDQLVRNNISYRYEYSDITRTVWVTSLKYGVELKTNNFVFDPFFGLGVRRLSIAHQPVGLVEYEYFEESDVWFPPIDRKEGIFYRPHVSMGVKVGYIIR